MSGLSHKEQSLGPENDQFQEPDFLRAYQEIQSDGQSELKIEPRLQESTTTPWA